MNDRQVSPPGAQILGDKAAMAAVRFRLAAQKNSGPIQQIAAEGMLDAALLHQPQESRLVLLPASLALLVIVEKRLRGRQKRLMDVFGAADCFEEEAQVFFLRKTGQLRSVVKPDVDQPPDARLLQTAEELS